MKLLIFSDIHNDLRALQKLMDIEADRYIAAGDLVSWARGLDAAGEVMKAKAEKVLVLPGNHESVRDIGLFCEKFKFRNFHEQSFEADGFQVAGLGYSNPTPFNTPGEYSEAELEEKLLPFAALKPLVLICHCPPKNTPLDRVNDKMHFGSESIAKFIVSHQPVRFFCGHIHEAEGVSAALGETLGTNVGKRGFLLDLATLKR
jgi:Icc-related predicted phosphoesterase